MGGDRHCSIVLDGKPEKKEIICQEKFQICAFWRQGLKMFLKLLLLK